MAAIADPLLATKVSEREAAESFIQELKASVLDRPGQGITDEEKQHIRSKQERISSLDSEIELLAHDVSMRDSVRDSLVRVSGAVSGGKAPVLYRSAGEYLHDAGLVLTTNDREAGDRIARYRAAEHILTADTPGIVPDPIVGPVLDFIDGSRPIVQALGTIAIPAGPTFHRPVLNDPNVDTGVDLQAAEKQELPSKKFTITRADVQVNTYGGYVNVSRQELDWGQNSLNIIVNQLATRYARRTEKQVAQQLTTTAVTEVLPAAPTSAQILDFLYKASNKVYAATGELANVAFVAPDVWATWGAMVGTDGRPLFTAVAPANNVGSAIPTSRTMNVAGFTVVVSYALAAGTALVTTSSNVEIYEQKIGTLSVTEPSVLGMQIAYAGYFTTFVPFTTGVVKAALAAGRDAK